MLAGDIQLWGDSDILTNINSGEGEGGNINLTADSIVVFDDSDIFVFAEDGQGGNITLDIPAFFAEILPSILCQKVIPKPWKIILVSILMLQGRFRGGDYSRCQFHSKQSQ